VRYRNPKGIVRSQPREPAILLAGDVQEERFKSTEAPPAEPSTSSFGPGL
jgi:hypothetical protein